MATSSITPFVSGLTQPTTSAAATTSSAGSTSSSSSSNANPLGSVNFLSLLTAQLQNQDPMSPVDDSQFTTQIAELSTVDSITQLNANFSQLLALQQVTQGANLIGQTVVYTPTGGTTAQQGVVSAVNIVNGNLRLTIGNNTVPMSQVNGVVQSALSQFNQNG